MKLSRSVLKSSIFDLNMSGRTKIIQSDIREPTVQIAEKIGSIIQIENRTDVDVLRVNSINTMPKNTYGGNYGHGELPLHTDLAHWNIPPKYLMLRCINPGVEVSTRFISYSGFVQDIPASLVTRALFMPRRRLDGRKFMLRLMSNGIFRWDTLFLKPANDDAHEIIERISMHEIHKKIEEIHLRNSGDFIIINNWSSLHGRSAVPANSLNRIIHRVYLSEIFN